MKAEAAHALVVKMPGNGIGFIDKALRAMKSRVETGNLRRAGKSGGSGGDSGQIVRLMQRVQRLQRLKRCKDACIDTHGPGENHAAMHNPVPDGDDINMREAGGQKGEDGGQPIAMLAGLCRR